MVSRSLEDRLSLLLEGSEPLQSILCGYELHGKKVTPLSRGYNAHPNL